MPKRLIGAAAILIAAALAVVASMDLRHAAAPPAAVSSAPINSITVRSAHQAVPDERIAAHAQQQALRMGTTDPTATSNPVTQAWRAAFAGKPLRAPNANIASPAQVGRPAPEPGSTDPVADMEPRLHRLAERAALSPTQMEQVAAVLRDERVRMANARQQSAASARSPEQIAQDVDAIRDQTDAQLRHLLDPKQFALLRDEQTPAAAAPNSKPEP